MDFVEYPERIVGNAARRDQIGSARRLELIEYRCGVVVVTRLRR